MEILEDRRIEDVHQSTFPSGQPEVIGPFIDASLFRSAVVFAVKK
jgi:hypothetical protein